MQAPPRPGRTGIRPWMIALIVVAVLIPVGYFALVFFAMASSMFGTREPTEDDYAQNVKEAEVAATKMGLRGTVLIAARRELVGIDVASQTAKTLYTVSGNWDVWSCAGPSKSGLAAFCNNDMMGKRHQLCAVDVDTGKTRVVFERRGDALWDDAMGEDMAVSSNADFALVLAGHGDEQLPGALMTVCRLEKVDLLSGAVQRFPFDVYEAPLALDSTGRYAYYVAGAPKALADSLATASGIAGFPSTSRPKTPVVHRLDTVTGTVEALFPGWGVALGGGDGTLLITSQEAQPVLFDLATKKARGLQVPDYAYWPVGMASKTVTVCMAKQARLSDVQMTRGNGLPGPRPMPRIIAVDPAAKQVSTLYQAVDPRNRVTYSARPMVVAASLGK